ncbi:MAG TPA: hypothetical protein VJO16_08075 [Candidatus Acidoferrum sp.]|nr:hypothetical protein [Candidatus Acidoferrum sp.]
MSSTPDSAVSNRKPHISRAHAFFTGVQFGIVLVILKLIHIRNNPQSWMAFRVGLGLGGAALVILPLSLWNSWIASAVGLGMFLVAILLPPAKGDKLPDDMARELGALVIVNGGKFRRGKTFSKPVQLYVGAKHIWVLDARFKSLLAIPTGEITSAEVSQAPAKQTCLLRILWNGGAAEFWYEGIFSEHLAQVAQTTILSVRPAPLPVLPRSRAASA